MELWNPSSENKENFFLDPFRKKWVKNRPEEIIRTSLVHKMVHELDYPSSYVALEKNLNSLPHLSPYEKKKIPNRRLDIVVFAKDIHPEHALFPLLLIECKVEELSLETANQVIGYNDVVRAPFVALANAHCILTGSYDHNRQEFAFVEGFFTYLELLEAVKTKGERKMS